MANRNQAKLTDEARLFVVHALAAFDPPSVVAAAVKKEFNLQVSPQGIEVYDPTKHAGRHLSKKWKAIFAARRKDFIEDTSKIGIAHRAMRLRALNRLAERAESMGNLTLTAQLYEQAAKETGDAYTNRHKLEHTGKDGGPVVIKATSVDERL